MSASPITAGDRDEAVRSFAKGKPKRDGAVTTLYNGLKRRWRRERRRRAVGRAYDMAIEVEPFIPYGGRVLDVGCGNGFIAHHLSALARASVLGIDVGPTPQAQIDYRKYDGYQFPVADNSVDAALLSYVLHHTQDVNAIFNELRRALKVGGCAVVYEDMPNQLIDRLICKLHDRQWRDRTGPCTFRTAAEWREKFATSGFAIVRDRPLSRWRNITHPVSRRLFVLQLKR